MNNYNDQQIIAYIFLSMIAICIIFCVLYGYFKLIYCCYKEYIQGNDINKPLMI